MDDITKIIQPSKPLQFINLSKDRLSKTGTRDAYRLTIANKQISNRLCELGCGYNKTFNLKFPTWINSEIEHHFIRDYFDGDGSISPCGGNSMLTITGNIDFIKELQSILANKCELSITKLLVRFKHIPSIVGMRYCGPRQLIRIRDYLYKDATLYLNRKYNKFSEIASTRNFS